MKVMTLSMAGLMAVSSIVVPLNSSQAAGQRGHGMVNHGTMPGANSQGSSHGTGWNHMNGPSSTGQPGFECEDVRPGQASSAPGSAFNEDGKAGTRYAGEQPQNSRNTASVSQYDTACLHQPQR